MSEENVEGVRQPLAVRAQSHRRLDERLAVRFPSALAFFARAVLRLSPRSRLRQAVLRRAAQLSFEAINRGDLEAAFVIVTSSDYETVPPPELVGLGFDPTFRGREGRVRFHREWLAELGEFRMEPAELIDLGDRVLVLGHGKGSGLSSGAPVVDEAALLLTISAGRLIREEVFRSHEQALEAAGLSE